MGFCYSSLNILKYFFIQQISLLFEKVRASKIPHFSTDSFSKTCPPMLPQLNYVLYPLVSKVDPILPFAFPLFGTLTSSPAPSSFDISCVMDHQYSLVS